MPDGAGVRHGRGGAGPAPSTRAGVAALDEPSGARAACTALVATGPSAVPDLIALLAASGHGAEREFGCCNALLVLGLLGERALTSIAEVRACVAHGSLAVRNQAIWALGRLAARSRDALIARDALHWIDLQQTPDFDPFVCREAIARLRLTAGASMHAVAHTQPPQLPLPWRDPGTLAGIAAAIAAGEVAVATDVLAELHRRLHVAVARDDLPWREAAADRAAAGLLGELFAARGEPIARDIALGLLEHWDPLLRQRAVAGLAPLGERPWAELAAVVGLLWDRDQGVRHAAAAALRTAGSSGLIGLRALRAFGGTGNDLGAACTTAADALVADAGAGGDAALHTLVAELDDAVRGRAVPKAAATVGAAAAAAIAAVVFGCRGAEAEQLDRVLAFAAVRAPADADVAIAVLRLLDTRDAVVQRTVLRWLPRFGNGLCANCPTMHVDVAVALAGAPRDVRGLAVESWAMALLPDDAPDEHLLAALDIGNARLLVRVAAILARRREVSTGLRDALVRPPVDGEAGWCLRLRGQPPTVCWSGEERALPGWTFGAVAAESTLAHALLCAIAGVPLPRCDAAAA